MRKLKEVCKLLEIPFYMCCGLGIVYLISLLPFSMEGQIAYDTCNLEYVNDNVWTHHLKHNLMEDEVHEYYHNFGNVSLEVYCNLQGEPLGKIRHPNTNEIEGVGCKYFCEVRFYSSSYDPVFTQEIYVTRLNGKREMDEWRRSMEEKNGKI